MNQQNFILVEPTAEMESEILAMAEEFQTAGDNRYQFAINDFGAYLERLAEFAKGENLPADRVPSNTYFLMCGGKTIGRSDLRHKLNPELEIIGGHIGYDIRPSERQKGFGTLILELTLEKARNIRLKRVFLTCDTDNVASAKIIERNGGKLERQILFEKTGKLISHYWIGL
ncbi:MAG: GNAT family N-acetyltransferase [Pyrinomonadaceae bacterium]